VYQWLMERPQGLCKQLGSCNRESVSQHIGLVVGVWSSRCTNMRVVGGGGGGGVVCMCMCVCVCACVCVCVCVVMAVGEFDGLTNNLLAHIARKRLLSRVLHHVGFQFGLLHGYEPARVALVLFGVDVVHSRVANEVGLAPSSVVALVARKRFGFPLECGPVSCHLRARTHTHTHTHARKWAGV
jgi:hypothetical protein